MAVDFSLDTQDLIVAVGGEWNNFAIENGAPELAAELIIGRSLFDFVSGNVTRQFVTAVLNLVRNTQRQIELNYRCDSSSERRYMLMTVSIIKTGVVRFQNEILHVEPRSKIVSMHRAQQRGRETPVRCSMCNLINLKHKWVEPDLCTLDNHSQASEFAVIYGICESCTAQLKSVANEAH